MWHAVPVGAGLGSECREKWLCTWGGYVLDQVGCSWRCWRHPDACGVGVKVADHHSRRAPWEALGDFIQGGSGRVSGLASPCSVGLCLWSGTVGPVCCTPG